MSMLTVDAPRVASRHAAAVQPAPDRRAPRERPDLRVVEAPRRRLRVGLVSTLLLATLFAGLFALAAMHSLVVQAQFELDRIDQQVTARQDQIDARRVEVAVLESPAAIVAAADELGMVSPDDVVHLESDDR